MVVSSSALARVEVNRDTRLDGSNSQEWGKPGVLEPRSAAVKAVQYKDVSIPVSIISLLMERFEGIGLPHHRRRWAKF